MRCLDANKDDIESCLDHHLHEVFMIGQFYGCLRIKGEGMLSHFHPFDDGRENLILQLFFVPNKIVVNEEDLAPETRRVHTLELSDNLVFVLGARSATAEQGDVAELAVEGAAPGILDIN